MMTALLLAPLLMGLAVAATPVARTVPKEAVVMGGYLTTPEGAPLYTYANDTMVGMSHCSGDCARDFPPLLAGAGAQPSGDWTLVAREDGARQWAFHDKPLYLRAKPQNEVGPFWAPAAANGAVNVASVAAVAPPPGEYRLSRTDSSQFTCDGDRKMLAQFVSRGSSLTAIVDIGEGSHTLPLVPWTGGEPQIAWSDGKRTLVWTSGVQLMWTEGPAHLACGRAAHNHSAMH